jgi:hypothetical protein
MAMSLGHLTSLALLHRYYARAQSLAERGLAICEKVLGPELNRPGFAGGSNS